MKKHLRTVLDIFKRHGCEVLERRDGKHWVFKLKSAAGRVVRVVVSCSPSDAYAAANVERDLIRELGGQSHAT